MNETITSQSNISVLTENVRKLAEKNTNNYGLYHGKAGFCVVYFLLSDIFKEKLYEIEARKLLDDISDNISNVQELDFANGLAGIGWGIEWLVQNNYVNANTDEILEDLDDDLYKSVIYAKSPCLSLANGTLGKAMYFYKRLMAQNPNPVRYKNLCNQECLVLLSDEINEIILNKETGWLSCSIQQQIFTPLQLTEIAQSLVFILKLLPHKINLEVTEKLICSITSFMQHYKKLQYNADLQQAYCYALYTYLFAGIKLNDRSCINNANELFETYETKISTHNSFFQNYMHQKIMHLLNRKARLPDFKTNQKPETIFDILSVCSLLNSNHAHTSWDEAWLLS